MIQVLALFLAAVGPPQAWPGDAARPPLFFAVSVSNLDASVDWYAKNLDLKATFPPPGPQARIAVLRGGGLLVELIESSTPHGPATHREDPRERYRQRGLVKVGFYVEDLDAVVARLKGRSARFVGSPYSDPVVGVRSVVVLDNEENLIQLFEPLPRR